MGTRYHSYYPCPKCGTGVEEYDAPSCLMFVAICENCNWSDPRDYYEIRGDKHGNVTEIILCTEKELNTLMKKDTEVKMFRKKLEDLWKKWEKKNNDALKSDKVERDEKRKRNRN